MTKLIHLKEAKALLKKKADSSKEVERKIEKLVEIIDELQEKVEILEARQLQLLRVVQELLARLEETVP